jgi:hypothetical protein
MNLPDKFNQQVEADLLSHDTHIMFHMVDRCTRWHEARLIFDKTKMTLVDTVYSMWIQRFGPMTELHMDGEAGLMRSEVGLALQRKHGIVSIVNHRHNTRNTSNAVVRYYAMPSSRYNTKLRKRRWLSLSHGFFPNRCSVGTPCSRSTA